MNYTPFARAALSALIVPALTLSFAPAFAAKSKKATAKAPVLTCNIEAADGLSYTVIKAGKGDKPSSDAKVKVNYTGRLRSDGSQFDAGQGSEFKVQGVVPGFGQGLQLMQPGGKYRLCIPAKLAYGEEGAGSIAPNSDLVFEVDLLSFTTPPPKPIIPVAERTCDKTTASGLGYAMIKAGMGPSPTAADMMLVDFQTFDAKTGLVLEKREWEKIPVGQTTAMFGEALKMMQAGASYRFCMPVKGDADPDAAQVNIKVELIAIRPAPEVE
jgi:FKBP-type peptidyl-prolyl cis-trans isomerase